MNSFAKKALSPMVPINFVGTAFFAWCAGLCTPSAGSWTASSDSSSSTEFGMFRAREPGLPWSAPRSPTFTPYPALLVADRHATA